MAASPMTSASPNKLSSSAAAKADAIKRRFSARPPVANPPKWGKYPNWRPGKPTIRPKPDLSESPQWKAQEAKATANTKSQMDTPTVDKYKQDSAARKSAITRKLASTGQANKLKAEVALRGDIAKAKKKGQYNKNFTRTYNTQAIRGKDEGFTESDFGAGNGAAIPYQVKDVKQIVGGNTGPKPKPPKKKK